MKRATHMWVLLAGLAMLVPLAIQPAPAGPFHEALAQRRAQIGQGGLFAGEDESGPVQVPAGTSILRDLAYGDGALQRMDVYAPPDAKAAPVIFMVHGGGWRTGDKAARGVVEGKVNHWLPRGYVFVSVDYPLLPDTPVLEQARDVARALAWAQGHARQWGGDPGRFILMGHSAGAHLVALVSANPSLRAAQGVQTWLATVALDSAAYDVPALMQERHFPLYDRAFGTDPATWAADSPTTQLATPIPPFLAVCSSQRMRSCPTAREFVRKAKALGSRAEILAIDKTHGQINKDLGIDVAYTSKVDEFLAQ